MRILKPLVAFYDQSLVKILGWKSIPGSETQFLYLVPKVHKGKEVTIKDGTVIRKGDAFFEIHIINTNLSHLDTGYGNLFKMLYEELVLVGEYMNLAENQEVKGVLGVTLLHRLARRAGFTIMDIQPKWKREMVSLGENCLRYALRKEKPKKDGKKRVAKECWISRNQVMAMRESFQEGESSNEVGD